LYQRYGENAEYSPSQVDVTIEKLGFSHEWSAYAHCMFCNFSDLADQRPQIASKWERLRKEIGNRFFHGRNDFTPSSFQKPVRRGSNGNPNDIIDSTINGSSDVGNATLD
jgi:hypothetical protein